MKKEYYPLCVQVVEVECESCLATNSVTESSEMGIETSSIEYEDWSEN